MSAVGDFLSGAFDAITGKPQMTYKAADKATKAAPTVSPAKPTTTPDFVPQKYQQMMVAAAQKYGISPDILGRVGRAESQFDPKAVGRKDPNDLGLMQVNKKNFPAIEKEIGGKFDPFDPSQSIHAAAFLLSQNRNSRFIKDDQDLALSYNLGSLGVGEYRAGKAKDMARGATYHKLLFPDN